MSEFKVGDRVRIKKNDIVGCIYEMTILENRGFGLDVTYYEMKYIYSVISEDRVYINLKEEDLELIDKFKEPTPIEELEQRIEKLEKEVFKPVEFHVRPEEPKPSLLTEDERVILRNLDKKYDFIARDEDGDLHIFSKKPEKEVDEWNVCGIMNYEIFSVFNDIFQFIKWTDNEPYNIEELLKGDCEE